MTITFGFTDELTNTRYAPLAALSAHYQQQRLLEPLTQVQIPMKIREFSPAHKLTQVLLSILAGCETLSEVNTTLKTEPGMAALWGGTALPINPALPPVGYANSNADRPVTPRDDGHLGHP
jgi:hypothetical protein